MTRFIIISFIVILIVLTVSLVRWNLNRALRKSLDFSDFEVFESLKVSTSTKLKAGEAVGIGMKCIVLINQRELHVIAQRFHPLLFMTDFPFTFAKKSNKKLKILSSDGERIIFTGKQRKSSVFGSELEVTIEVYNEEEKKEMAGLLKSWK